MKNEKRIKLYHGSYTIVDKPELSKCHEGKDFGKGFYLTTDFEQAKRFTRASIRKAKRYGLIEDVVNEGYVSIFEFVSTEELSVHSFENADSTWLHCVAAHRKEGSIDGEAERWVNYDTISGKIANDKTNTVITAYINGLYGEIGTPSADETAIRMLEPENLKNQFCFRTEKAIDTLEYKGYERVDNK